MKTRRFYRTDKSTAPTEVQMKLAISQTLAQPFAYNAPVVVLDFEVDENGGIIGKFKDAARPRVFEFELDGESVNYKPYKIERIDSNDIESWEEFSSGFSYRVDAGVATKGKKPQCVKPTAYNCGAACINIMKSCKIKTDDPTIKDRLKKLKTIGEDYAKTTPKTKAKKPPASTPELKPEPKKVAPEVKKQQSTNLVGDGTHEGTPRNAQEYYEAVIKTGKQITLKDARDTIAAVKYWTGSGSWNIRKDQKAGKPNERGDKIDEFIRNSTPYKGEIYRGLHFNSKEEALNWAKGDKDGVLGNQSAHASWTSDFKIASHFSNLNFSDENSAQVIIKSVNKSGVSIRNLSEFGGTNKTGVDEKEVVVSKGTRHKVKNVKEENGVIIVEVEEVDSPPEKSSTKQEEVKTQRKTPEQKEEGKKGKGSESQAKPKTESKKPSSQKSTAKKTVEPEVKTEPKPETKSTPKSKANPFYSDEPIKDYDTFKKEIPKELARINFENNYNKLIPVSKVKEELKGRISNDDFDNYIKQIHSESDDIGLETGSGEPGKDAIKTSVGKAKDFISFSNESAMKTARKEIKRKPGQITELKDFEKEIDNTFGELGKKYNDLVPIHAIRDHLGDKVSKGDFNNLMVDIMENDRYLLKAGEMSGLTPDKREKSITLPSGGFRFYLAKVNDD